MPGMRGVHTVGELPEENVPEDIEVIDVFSPPREDFLSGAGMPEYMRPR